MNYIVCKSISAPGADASALITKRNGTRTAGITTCIVGLLVALADAPLAHAQCDSSLLAHYGGEASLVARSGSRTYAVFGEELFVYEGSIPDTAPDELGSVLVPGDHLYDLAASGPYAYLAARNSGLIVIDATDPNTPFVAGTLLFPDDPLLITYANDHVYLCESTSGSHDVFIVDVSTPSSPTQVGTYSPSSVYVGGIVVDGSTLFVSTDSGVQIVDVSVPALPTFVTTYFFGIAYLDIDVSSGVMAAVRRDTNFADIADVSNPASPTAQSLINASFLSRVALNTAGDRLYLGYTDTEIWDISTLSGPVPHASFSNFANDYAVANTRLLITSGSGGLEQWNAGDIDAPVREWQIAKSPQGADLAANSNRVVLPEGDVLRVFDTSEPGSAVELPSVDILRGNPEKVAIAGDLACVIYDSDLSIIDLAAPGGAEEIGWEPTIGSATAVAATDSLALVGQLGSIVEIFDISNPASPVSLGSVDVDPISPPTTGSVTKIAIQGSFACVSTFGDTYIISFVNPSSPQVEHEFNVVDPPVDIAVRPGLLCLVNNDQLRVDLYDLSSPPIPTFVGSYDETILTPSKVAVDGDLLAIFDNSQQFSEIIFVDISNPAVPAVISRIASNPYAQKLAITGNRVWRHGGSPGDLGYHTGLWELTRPGFDAVSPPDDVVACSGDLAQFSIFATGSLGYQWRRDGMDLSNGFTGNGSLIAGAFSDTLSIFSVASADAGDYDCVLTNSCGTSTTSPAVLTICTADLNCDHQVDLSDLAELLANYDQPGPWLYEDGDLDGDGDVDLSDLATLLSVYGTTCP